MLKKILLILVSMLVFFWCSGEMPDSKKEYIWNWESNISKMKIYENWYLEYNKVSWSTNVSINAPIKKFEDDKFIVGILFLTTDFVINTPPYTEWAYWKMKIDNIEYQKSRWTWEIPSKEKLIELIKNTNKQFYNSYKNKDISIMYSAISEKWKKSIPKEEFSKIIIDGWDERLPNYIWNNLDWKWIIINNVPTIIGGELIIRWTLNYDIPFSMSYIFEYPEWKLLWFTYGE